MTKTIEVFDWEDWRAARGLPVSLECKEPGKCFDCGEDYRAADRHFHTRVTTKGFTRFTCCACVDNICQREETDADDEETKPTRRRRTRKVDKA